MHELSMLLQPLLYLYGQLRGEGEIIEHLPAAAGLRAEDLDEPGGLFGDVGDATVLAEAVGAVGEGVELRFGLTADEAVHQLVPGWENEQNIGCYQKIKSQKMQNPIGSHLEADPSLSSHVSEAPTTLSIFDKYRAGYIPLFSAFRLYSTDVSCEEDSSQTPDDALKTRGSYRKYTLQEKEEAVEKIRNGHDVKEVSRQYGIPRRNLLRWRKNGCERKEGGGRPTDHEMECILYDKIKKRQINGEKEIRSAAIKVSRSDNFKASKGWFSKFCRRYKLQTGHDLLCA